MWDGTSVMRSQIAITLFDFVNIKTHEESNKYVKLLRKAWKKWIEKDKKILKSTTNPSKQSSEKDFQVHLKNRVHVSLATKNIFKSN